MATPTFNANDLVDAAAKEQSTVAQVRAYIETMPGANGAYAQTHGIGPRYRYVSGFLHESAATAVLAKKALFDAYSLWQGRADGKTVAAYVDADENSWTSCMLMDYSQASLVAIDVDPTDKTKHRAMMAVRATILELAP